MMIEFRIKTLDGSDHKIAIDDESTIQELKDTIFAQMGVEPSLQRLIFCGRAMQDDKKLKEYKVHGKVVHMVQRAPPGLESHTSSSLSSSVPVTPENRQSNPINSSRVQQMFGLGSIPHGMEERRSGQSPTAIRLENLREIISDIKRGISDLTGAIHLTQELSPDSEVRSENGDVEIEDNARSNSASHPNTRPADFANLVSEVNELERSFAPYREEYIRILREASTMSGPLRESDLQRRMAVSDRATVVYHHLAHAYHLISDINLLLSHDNSRLASEVFIRQTHHVQALPNSANVNMAGSNADVPLRQGNQNSNLPMNIGVLDPITVQVQIETRVPIGMGVLNVPRAQGQGQNQQASQSADSNRTGSNERIGQTVPNVPPAAGQVDGRDEAPNNQTTGDQQANVEPTVDSLRDRFRQLNDRQRDLIIQQFEETEDIDGFEVNFTSDDLRHLPIPLMQSVLHHINQSRPEQAQNNQSSATTSVAQSQNEQQSASESRNEGSNTQERNQNEPQTQQPLVQGNQQENPIQDIPQIRVPPAVATDNQRGNGVIGFATAGDFRTIELPIDMEELPLGNNLQNLLGGQQNIGGAEHNVFLAQMPLHGTQPSAELIQQILSSVIRQGLVPGVMPNANWQVVYPNSEQNPGANANPGATAQTGTTQNEGSSESRPNNQGPQVQNPQRPQPGPSAPRLYQLAQVGVLTENIVFDQVLPCESFHIRQALRERSGANSNDGNLAQFTDSGSPRAMFNLESLFQRFERNQRSSYAIVLAGHLILRESIVPGVHRFLHTRDLVLLGATLTEYVRGLFRAGENGTNDDWVDQLIDTFFERHQNFYNRIMRMVPIRAEVDFTASLRAVLRHYLLEFGNLPAVRDPGDFCRTMRQFIPRFYHDFCAVVDYCLEDDTITSFQELYRSFFIYSIENMDETTSDILYSIAMYNMNVATDRLERHPNGFLRPIFVVPLAQQQMYPDSEEMSLPDDEDTLDASMSSGASTEDATTVSNASTLEDSPMPSSSTAGLSSEPSALPTRNIYSGAVPRTRPVMRTSRKVNNKMPVRYRSNIASTSGSVPQSSSRNRTSSTTPSSPQTPNVQSTPPGCSMRSLMQINRRDTPRPPRRDHPRVMSPDNSESDSVPMFPNFDLWGREMQRILQRDRLSQTSLSLPFSDAYISGMPLKKRHCIRQARPPTTLNGFIEDVVMELEESIEIENRFREMFEEFLRAGVRDRRERSIDFNPDRFTSVVQLLNDETTVKSTSSNDENSRQDGGGAA